MCLRYVKLFVYFFQIASNASLNLLFEIPWLLEV